MVKELTRFTCGDGADSVSTFLTLVLEKSMVYLTLVYLTLTLELGLGGQVLWQILPGNSDYFFVHLNAHPDMSAVMCSENTLMC